MTIAVWLLLLAGVVYAAALIILRRAERPFAGFAAQGYLILWRSSRGNRLMERAARPAKLWRAVGDAGLLCALAFGIGTLAFFLLRATRSVIEPPFAMIGPSSPGALFAIPGLHPAIPLVVGTIALVFAILVHEAGHGIMAYANGMRIKSAGIMFAILPVGAFVEPEENDSTKATRRQKLRVIAAGPAANLLTMATCVILLQAIVLPSIAEPASLGVGVVDVAPGSSANLAELQAGDIILRVAGRATSTPRELGSALADIPPGATADVEYRRASSLRSTSMTAPPEGGRFGLQGTDLRFQAAVLRILRDPFHDGLASFEVGSAATPPGSFMLFLTYPVASLAFGDDPLTGETTRFLTSTGPLAAFPPAALAGAASFLYWSIWINLSMAAFNLLPITPLDGGQAIREMLSSRRTSPARRARTLQAITIATLIIVLTPFVAARAWGIMT